LQSFLTQKKKKERIPTQEEREKRKGGKKGGCLFEMAPWRGEKAHVHPARRKKKGGGGGPSCSNNGHGYVKKRKGSGENCREKKGGEKACPVPCGQRFVAGKREKGGEGEKTFLSSILSQAIDEGEEKGENFSSR